MSFKSAEKIDAVTYSVELTATPEEFKKYVRSAYEKRKGEFTVPGFRKGKGTQHLIEQYYGKGVFYEDALDIFFSDTIMDSYKEGGIEPVGQPFDFDIVTISAEEGIDLTFKVNVAPEIVSFTYKGLEAVKAADAVATDEEIDSEIETIRSRHGRMVDIDDRAVEDGDIVNIDYLGSVDGVPFDGGKAEGYDLTIGSHQFIPGFEEAIIGHSKDEEFDIDVTFPEEYHAELAGKAAVFKIKINAIKVKELPEVDDEFAKDDDYDSLEDMKAAIKAEILDRKQEEIDADFKNELFTKLAESVELNAEIPECMVDSKVQENIRRTSDRIAQNGLDFETYLSMIGQTVESFAEAIRGDCVPQIKFELAIAEIIKQEGLEATEEDIEAEYAKMAEMYGIDAEELKKYFPAENLSEQILYNKAVAVIVDNAVALEKPEEEEAETDAAEEAAEESTDAE